MSKIIKFAEVKVGDTIRVTRTPEDEPGYLTIEQGVVDHIHNSGPAEYTYADDKYGNMLADEYSDEDSVIELIDRPKEPLKVGDVITMGEFQGTPYGTIGVTKGSIMVWPVWHTNTGVYLGADRVDTFDLAHYEVTVLRLPDQSEAPEPF